jgi:hypothetical protein
MQYIRFTLDRLETEFMTSFDISNHHAQSTLTTAQKV